MNHRHSRTPPCSCPELQKGREQGPGPDRGLHAKALNAAAWLVPCGQHGAPYSLSAHKEAQRLATHILLRTQKWISSRGSTPSSWAQGPVSLRT